MINWYIRLNFIVFLNICNSFCQNQIDHDSVFYFLNVFFCFTDNSATSHHKRELVRTPCTHCINLRRIFVFFTRLNVTYLLFQARLAGLVALIVLLTFVALSMKKLDVDSELEIKESQSGFPNVAKEQDSRNNITECLSKENGFGEQANDEPHKLPWRLTRHRHSLPYIKQIEVIYHC